MKLRTQLIVAFLLLAALPLTAVTLYSYGSSLRALRHAVRAESQALTEDMGRRMELVTEDLGRRVHSLGELPYAALVRGNGGPAGDRAGRFVGELVARMGEAAGLVESLEFTPMTPPTPPAVPAPGTPPVPAAEVGRVVIKLSHLLFAGPEDRGHPARFEEAVSVLREGGGLMLLPRKLAEGQVELPEGSEVAMRVLERIADRERKHLAAAVAGGVLKGLEAGRWALAEAAEAARREPRLRELALPHRFDADVRREGELVGKVTCNVDATEVLRSVLSRTRRDRKEVPFALDGSGRLYTAVPHDAAAIGELPLAELAAGGGPGPAVAEWGDWILVMQRGPSPGLAFGIARPVGQSLRKIRRTAGRNLIFGLGLVAVAMIGTFPLSRRMTRNLSTLTAGAGELARGNLTARVAVRSRDEFGALGKAFNRMAEELRGHQERLVEQERLQKELDMCRRIQAELLPPRTTSFGFAEVRALSIPARVVGGDFFNYFSLPEGDVALLMGDVSGKGLPAALMMANLQATLRARLPLERDLARLAEALDRELEESTAPETYLTLFLGIIEARTGTLRFVNAGHNPQYLVSAAAELRRLEPSGRPLGLLAGAGYVEHRVALREDDVLFLFTDGLTEAENASGETFGAERLESLLRDAAASGPDELLRRAESAVREHRGSAEAADDATLLVLRLAGAVSPAVTIL